MKPIYVDYASIGAGVAENTTANLAWQRRHLDREPDLTGEPRAKNYGGIVLIIDGVKIQLAEESYFIPSSIPSQKLSIHSEQMVIASALNKAIELAKTRQHNGEPLTPPWDFLAAQDYFDILKYKGVGISKEEAPKLPQELYDKIKIFKSSLNLPNVKVELFTERHPCGNNGTPEQHGCEGLLKDIFTSPQHKIYYSINQFLNNDEFKAAIFRIYEKYNLYREQQQNVIQADPSRSRASFSRRSGSASSSSSSSPFPSGGGSSFSSRSDNPFPSGSGFSFSSRSGNPFPSDGGSSFSSRSDNPFPSGGGSSFSSRSDNSFPSGGGSSFSSRSDNSFPSGGDSSFSSRSDNPFPSGGSSSFLSRSDNSFPSGGSSSFLSRSDNPFPSGGGFSFSSRSGNPFPSGGGSSFSSRSDNSFPSGGGSSFSSRSDNSFPSGGDSSSSSSSDSSLPRRDISSSSNSSGAPPLRESSFPLLSSHRSSLFQTGHKAITRARAQSALTPPSSPEPENISRPPSTRARTQSALTPPSSPDPESVPSPPSSPEKNVPRLRESQRKRRNSENSTFSLHSSDKI